MMNKNITLFRNLKTIKGISNYWAIKICTKLGIDKSVLYRDLSDFKLEQLSTILSNLKSSRTVSLASDSGDAPLVSNAQLSTDTREEDKGKLIQRNLDVQVRNSILKLISIKSYRGRRLKLGLPAHGQRTWSNGRTSKKFKRCESIFI